MAYEGAHAQRVKRELQAAGVTGWGMIKFAMNYLPKIIGRNEHIEGIAYGRYTIGNEKASTNWEEGTLVATNHRVIFLDKKPGFIRQEDIPYDEVSGVTSLKAWRFSAITLLSKVGSFSLRYVSNRCADKFINYVEQRRLQPASA